MPPDSAPDDSTSLLRPLTDEEQEAKNAEFAATEQRVENQMVQMGITEEIRRRLARRMRQYFRAEWFKNGDDEVIQRMIQGCQTEFEDEDKMR